MTNIDPREVELIVGAVRRELPDRWADTPPGWPNEIEAALIDAVLSIRAVYGRPYNGVRGAVGRWRAARSDAALDDLRVLASHDARDLAEVLDRRQRVAGGATKAEAIVQAAHALTQAGFRHAADVVGSPSDAKSAYTGVRGLGSVTWTYLLMLLQVPDVKADTWIVRFVDAVVGRAVTTEEARVLLVAAAEKLEVCPTTLDHAVWSHMRPRR